MAEITSVAEVRKILGKRRTSSGVEYLVKWKGRGQTKEYWVPLRFLHQSSDMVKAYNRSNKVEPTKKPTPAVERVHVTFNRTINKALTMKKSNPTSGQHQITKVKSRKGAGKLKSNPMSVEAYHGPSGHAVSSHQLKSELALTPDRVESFKLLPPTISITGHVQSHNSGNQNGAVVKQKRKYTRQTGKDDKQLNGSVSNDQKWPGTRKGRNAIKSGVRLASSTQTCSKLTTRRHVSKLVTESSDQSKDTKQNMVKSPFTQCKTSDTHTEKDVDTSMSKKLTVKMPGVNVFGKKRQRPVRKQQVDRTDTVSTSDSEGMLYSLADTGPSSCNGVEAQRPVKRRKTGTRNHKQCSQVNAVHKKHLVLKLKDLKHEYSEINTSTTPDSDPEVTFKTSPRKLLLKDSIRPKEKANKSVSSVKDLHSAKFPQSPPSSSTALTTCQTPPRPTSVLTQRDPSPSLGSTNNLPRIPAIIPVLPNTPPAPRYDALVKHMTHCNQGKGVKRALGADSKEPIERRVSVRQSESVYKYKEIVVKKNQNYTQIWLFSQTKRKNALNPNVFQELIQALHNAKFDDTRVVLLTGSGRVFCSGIDLHYLTADSLDKRSLAKNMADSMREFVDVLVAFPKPVVAAVNGPAVGLGVAILPLCDIIYASDKASFYCPYTRLGQTPEGCASYTFPQAMGLAMANELLLPGRKITALEAYQIGLVSQVFWPTSMMQEVIPRLQQMAVTSAKALEASKVLIRSHVQGKLKLTVETECQMLTELWPSGECQRAILSYIEEDEDMML